MDKKKQTEFDFNVANATRRSKSIKTKKTTRQKSRELMDKFYTRPECVKHLVETVLRFFPRTKFFVEPSAGSGNFNHYLADIGKKVIAYDLAPESLDVIKADYFKTTVPKQKHITIGNPPFGYKGNLAVAFLNKALRESDAVGFIMPVTAKKYSLQNKILPDAHLIYQESLPADSFELPDKSIYSCPSVFQIWTLKKHGPDLRKQKPKTSHNDFKLYRHNATAQSAKYVDLDWDFAIYAQGRKDYTKIFLPKDKSVLCNKIKNTSDQFYFFIANNKEILKRLMSIDFDDLAHRDHITPGFCKNDIIEEYDALVESKN